MTGSLMHSTAVINTGMCSGRHPAITALAAIFSTVATPKPGSKVVTTSWGFLVVPAIMRSTRSGVGGTNGKPSLHRHSKNCRFMTSMVSSRSFPSKLSIGSVMVVNPASTAGPLSGGSVKPWITWSMPALTMDSTPPGL